MRFPIMTFGYIVLTDAFSHHDHWQYCSYRCVFPSCFLVTLFSQMRFRITIFGYTVLTDAFSHHDLWLYWSFQGSKADARLHSKISDDQLFWWLFKQSEPLGSIYTLDMHEHLRTYCKQVVLPRESKKGTVGTLGIPSGSKTGKIREGIGVW